MIKLTALKPNPGNPRILKDEAFQKLVNSINEFPKMMELRPIITDAEGLILAGNMRYKALKFLKYKEIPDDWVKLASDLTPEETKRFVIQDNAAAGSWDWELLANEWDVEDLNSWGLDVPFFDDTDYSGKNKELSPSDFENQKYIFKLEYSEKEYIELKEKIVELGKSPESIFYEALVSL